MSSKVSKPGIPPTAMRSTLECILPLCDDCDCPAKRAGSGEVGTSHVSTLQLNHTSSSPSPRLAQGRRFIPAIADPFEQKLEENCVIF